MDIIRGCNSPVIAAFGNPLLDMHVTIDTTDILDKYGLDLDCEKEVPKEELVELQELSNRYPSVTSAGGSAQNTLRIFQWLVARSSSSVIFGAVGQDEEGKTLEALMKSSDVCTKYTYNEELSTGRCVALVKDEHRALVAHIGAAAVYKPHHLDQKDHLDILAQSKIVYIEGFFISHSFPVADEVATFCKSRGILIAFNLSSVYVCRNNAREVLQLINFADIVFGNEEAYRALAESSEQTSKMLTFLEFNRQDKNKGTTREQVTHSEISSPASKVTTVFDERKTTPATLFRNLRLHGKVCIATNGPCPVMCKTTRGEYFEVPVPPLDSGSVKDTTGAGDAFVAGFLAGVVKQENLEACITLGCRTAARVIQHIGCQVPTCSQSELMRAA